MAHLMNMFTCDNLLASKIPIIPLMFANSTCLSTNSNRCQELVQFTPTNSTLVWIHKLSYRLLIVCLQLRGYNRTCTCIRNNIEHLKQLVHHLATKYSLKELQPLHFFLGIEVIPTTDELFLTHQCYMLTVAKTVATPLSTTAKTLTCR